MEYRRLGRTGLQVSVIGLGSGGVSLLGQSNEQPREHSHRVVRAALNLGINHFDTAPTYKESESLLGEALQGIPRAAYTLTTKFSPLHAVPGELRKSLEHSLRRLRTDYVDVLYLHSVLPEMYDSVVDQFMPELQDVKTSGLTRFIGLTEFVEVDPEHAALRRALDGDLFDVLMVGYNLIAPSAIVEVLPRAEKQDVGVVIMCAVRAVISNPVLLREHLRSWQAEGRLAADALSDERPLDWVLGQGVGSLTAAAYKFAAESAAVGSVLTGTANVAHLEANVEAITGPPLPPVVSDRLKDLFVPVGRSVLRPGFQL